MAANQSVFYTGVRSAIFDPSIGSLCDGKTSILQWRGGKTIEFFTLGSRLDKEILYMRDVVLEEYAITSSVAVGVLALGPRSDFAATYEFSAYMEFLEDGSYAIAIRARARAERLSGYSPDVQFWQVPGRELSVAGNIGMEKQLIDIGVVKFDIKFRGIFLPLDAINAMKLRKLPYLPDASIFVERTTPRYIELGGIPISWKLLGCISAPVEEYDDLCASQIFPSPGGESMIGLAFLHSIEYA